jgi:hypothetical protein
MRTLSKNRRSKTITIATESRGDLTFFLTEYAQQPELTGRLDMLGKDNFTQHVINEIVLWKVNRYVSLTPDILQQIDQLRKLEPGKHRKEESVLTVLLGVHGVDLAMASTILRFRNPAVFQILDQRAYRVVFGCKYPLSPKSATDRKVALYFDYVDALVDLCAAKGLAFETIDRLLYKFDQAKNGKL